MFRIRHIINSILYHFAPVLAFYFAHLFGGVELGLKVALSISVIFAITYHKIYKTLSYLFITFAIYFCYLGLFTIYLETAILSKYEFLIQISYLSLVFLFSLFTSKNILERFFSYNKTIESILGFKKNQIYKVFTFLWSLYFAFYAIINSIDLAHNDHYKNQNSNTSFNLNSLFFFLVILTLSNSHLIRNSIKSFFVKDLKNT